MKRGDGGGERRLNAPKQKPVGDEKGFLQVNVKYKEERWEAAAHISSRRPVRRKHDVALVNEQNMQTKNAKCKEFHPLIRCLLNEVPNTTK